MRTGVGIVLAGLALLAAWAGLATTDDGQRSASYAGLSALAAVLGTLAVAPVVARGALLVLAAPFARSSVGRLAP